MSALGIDMLNEILERIHVATVYGQIDPWVSIDEVTVANKNFVPGGQAPYWVHHWVYRCHKHLEPDPEEGVYRDTYLAAYQDAAEHTRWHRETKGF